MTSGFPSMRLGGSPHTLSRRAWIQAAAATTLGAFGAVGCARHHSLESSFTIGYLANFTHAQPLVGALHNRWSEALGSGTRIMAFSAGPEIMEALAAGSLDAAFLGPAPVVNGYVRSHGERFQVVCGAMSGGASLVARRALGIREPQNWRKCKVASPQLGNTQDVSLRTYLKAHGLAPTAQGGDVLIVPLAYADTLQLLRRGELDGAWVPEPWASRMVAQAACERVVDERTLWPKGRFPTTLLVASRNALRSASSKVHTLASLLQEETDRLSRDPIAAAHEVNQALGAIMKKPLSEDVLTDAWSRMDLTTDPMPDALLLFANQMRAIGYLPANSIGLDGIVYQAEVLSRRAMGT